MRINGEQACDGIWDVMSTNNVVDFVREELNQGKGPELVAKDLTAKCLGLGSRDNMTALIVSLAAAPQSDTTTNTQLKASLSIEETDPALSHIRCDVLSSSLATTEAELATHIQGRIDAIQRRVGGLHK